VGAHRCDRERADRRPAVTRRVVLRGVSQELGGAGLGGRTTLWATSPTA
jgi:hypothetical protein